MCCPIPRFLFFAEAYYDQSVSFSPEHLQKYSEYAIILLHKVRVGDFENDFFRSS